MPKHWRRRAHGREATLKRTLDTIFGTNRIMTPLSLPNGVHLEFLKRDLFQRMFIIPVSFQLHVILWRDILWKNQNLPEYKISICLFAEIYGRSLNIYSWNERKLKQTINLGDDGIAPLEIRFLHNPLAAEGFVGCAVTSNVYRFYKADDNLWKAEKVIQVVPKKVEGWVTPLMSGTIRIPFFFK